MFVTWVMIVIVTIVTLSPLLDQMRLHGAIVYLDVNHFHKELLSWTWSLLGPNIIHLKVCGYPLHAKAVSCNVFPHIMIALYDITCVFVSL